MDNNRNLGSSIKLNLKHKLQINPNEKDLEGKIVRGSDVPFFKALDKKNIGMQVKQAYNDCMNLSGYRPTDPMSDELVAILTVFEDEAVKIMKNLKKKKKDYSRVWKDNFDKYRHIWDNKNDQTLDYDDEDPFDDEWMNHPILETSPEMHEAGETYLAIAESACISLNDLILEIKTALQPVMDERNTTFTSWAKNGGEQVRNHLRKIQGEVDKILASEWSRIQPFLNGEFEGIAPSYIGSTNTGQKAITKAYIQFNPKDYDVDGQLISTSLYVALAKFNATASKERIFVRPSVAPVLLKIHEELKNNPDEEELRYLTNFEGLLNELLLYVDKVEAKLIQLPGVHEDPEDRFDLAIVRKLQTS